MASVAIRPDLFTNLTWFLADAESIEATAHFQRLMAWEAVRSGPDGSEGDGPTQGQRGTRPDLRTAGAEVTPKTDGYSPRLFVELLELLRPILTSTDSHSFRSVLMELAVLLPQPAFMRFWREAREQFQGARVDLAESEAGRGGIPRLRTAHLARWIDQRLDLAQSDGPHAELKGHGQELELQALAGAAIRGIHVLASAVRVLLGHEVEAHSGALGVQLCSAASAVSR